MATKTKEIIEVTHREENLLTLAARQKGVPIEQLLAHVAPKIPNKSTNQTKAPTKQKHQPNAKPARPR